MRTILDIILRFICLAICAIVIGCVSGYLFTVAFHMLGFTWSLYVIMRNTVIIVFVILCIGHIIFRKK